MSGTLGDRILWRDGEFQLSQCAVCRHKTLGESTCEAFPERIPAAILSNDIAHVTSIDGDRGFLLEPIEITRPLFEAMTRLDWPAYSPGTE